MKRCPECRRDYYDDTLLYCLEDGNALVQGSVPSPDDPATAILSVPGAVATGDSAGEAATRAQINTTDQTAILPTGAEAEPRESLGGLSEKQSVSTNRAAKPLIVAAVAVAVLVGGFFGYKYLSPTKQIESIAVMPFVNESGNAEIEYLSDGMTETLISSLSQVANLNVKGRSSVFRYKGKDVDTKTLGKELGVEAVLYGRVIQRGDQLTLSLELLDALTENVIWSGKYDRKQADVVTLQSEIARDVSNKLKSRLSGTDVAKVEKGYTANPEAYKLYLQGRFYWNKRTAADIKQSMKHFEQAIALDPSYALAYAGLADAWQVLPSYTDDPPSEVAYPNARTAAMKALELDPMLAEPHAALAVVLHEYEWKHAEAEREFKRAIELDPTYASAHQWYGEYLMNMGRVDESFSEMQRALELDPFSEIINAVLGRVYYFARRYDESIKQFRKTHELYPGRVFRYSIRVYEEKGMYAEAIDLLGRPAQLDDRAPELVYENTDALRDALERFGAQGYWKKRLELAKEYGAPGSNDNLNLMVRIHANLGNKTQALDLLESAFESRKYNNCICGKLKGEPRF